MNTLELPENYHLIRSVDFTKDKKAAIGINVGSILFVILFILFGFIIFGEKLVLGFGFKELMMLLAAYVIMIIIHEWIHGLAIKWTSGFKVNYGFNGMYAYAGNKEAFFDKSSYLKIAMAPVVVLGIAILLLMIFLPDLWFGFFFLLQAFNISGASGDFYISYITLKMPDDVLVNDSGTTMGFYSSQEM